MHDIKRVIQVNVSFTRLWDGRVDHFTRNGLNPEIVFDARALERFSRADFSAVAEALRKNALTVTFPDGKTYDARLIGVAPDYDLAVLQVAAPPGRATRPCAT